MNWNCRRNSLKSSGLVPSKASGARIQVMLADAIGVGSVGRGFATAVAHPINAMAWMSCWRRSFVGVG